MHCFRNWSQPHPPQKQPNWAISQKIPGPKHSKYSPRLLGAGLVPWKHPGSEKPGPVPRPSKAKAWLRAMAETQGRSKSPSPMIARRL